VAAVSACNASASIPFLMSDHQFSEEQRMAKKPAKKTAKRKPKAKSAASKRKTAKKR
jgi:hypothetical protein